MRVQDGCWRGTNFAVIDRATLGLDHVPEKRSKDVHERFRLGMGKWTESSDDEKENAVLLGSTMSTKWVLGKFRSWR